MTCPSCQHANPPESGFCLGCGARLALACASCGARLPAGSRFCNKCGTPVAAERDAPEGLPSPEAYTPKHLAEKILTSKAALEGERKQVTVLFADLKGSMELLADRDPEDARKLLDPVLERMMEAVHRYEGTVNQVMGDGIMALFGAPLAHEDHAVRACYAALRMQESVKRYAAGGAQRRGHPDPDPRRPQLRRGGGPLHRQRPAHGLHGGGPDDASGGAHGADGHAGVDPHDRRHAEPGGGLRPGARRSAPVPVKGLGGPIEVYEIDRSGDRALPLAGRGRARPDGFVGRDAEMEQLYAAPTRRATDGHGQVVAVVGEPGVGKSRLFWEFTRSHRIAGWLVLESRSVSYGKAMLYLPVIDLLKAYFQIDDRDDPPRRMREKVTGKLLSLDEALRADPAGAAGTAGPARWTTPRGRRSTRRSAASARSTPSSACCSARARCSRWCSCSRICTGSTPRPRRCSTAWSTACRPRGCCSW